MKKLLIWGSLFILSNIGSFSLGVAKDGLTKLANAKYFDPLVREIKDNNRKEYLKIPDFHSQESYPAENFRSEEIHRINPEQ